MGAGILPATIHNGKLHFLFGKENKYDDTPGWSDFGGGTEISESFLKTAIREAGEEITGFLGTDADIKGLLTKHGTFDIDYHDPNPKHSTYRMHVFPMEYNHFLPLYYNNNQKFIQKRLEPEIIENSTIFEKEEIRWICVDDLKQMKPKFRSYFQNILEKLLARKTEINQFVRTKLHSHSHSRKHSTFKRAKTINNRRVNHRVNHRLNRKSFKKK